MYEIRLNLGKMQVLPEHKKIGSPQVRTKKRKKLTRPRQPMEMPTVPNERWSMDFASDQLSSGRRLRMLNVVGDSSREMAGQLVSVSISGRLPQPSQSSPHLYQAPVHLSK